MTTPRWDDDPTPCVCVGRHHEDCAENDGALTCVGCSSDVDLWDLCSHDDGPGAVCPSCCRRHHPDEVAA